MERDKADLIKMNFNIINIDISNESREEIINKINSVDAIFISGGNCFYLLQQLKIKNILNNIIEFANKKIYIGVSAGACIACPNIDYVQKLDDKSEAPLIDNYDAMNLVNFNILPHYKSKEKYTKLADEIEQDYPDKKFIKITNEQAIMVDENNNYKIIETE